VLRVLHDVLRVLHDILRVLPYFGSRFVLGLILIYIFFVFRLFHVPRFLMFLGYLCS
ncbi:hypothetical protein LINGRAHAP2_LOCUS30935, partial [Linum grandiflorum]